MRAVAAALMMIAIAAVGATAQDGPGLPELRAVWVDAFHHGIRSPAEAAQLVADAQRTHVNTLFVQVRRRADALYTGGLEPPLDDPSYDPSFDALAHIVSAAHAAGLQVHAWVNAMPVWRDEAPPKDARHLFNQHGPAAAGERCWLTRMRDGTRRFPVGYFLDPGHPAACDHLVAVCLDIVRRYDVDGLHFDYIRYPETEGAPLPRGADVGYNQVSVARFQRAYKRARAPLPDDEAWTRWRREQITSLVRRISIEARAIKPRLKVSAAVVAWGPPPASARDFENASPMQRVFQDWRGWLEEGLIDLAVPMNYAREHDERGREWFDGWIAWEAKHKGDRQLAVGVGGYLSAPEGVLAQISRVRSAAREARADGVSLFSYYQPSMEPVMPEQPAAAQGAASASQAQPAGAPPPPAPDRLDYLVRGAAGAPAAFTGPAPVPAMAWIDAPAHGALAGSIAGGAGALADRRTVRIRQAGPPHETRTITSDASGWFGAARLPPGTYQVQLEDARGKPIGPRKLVRVAAGAVARVTLAAR